METFNFPYHSVEDRWPENSTKVQFGKGWEFASKPRGPAQLQFRLSFNGMLWFVDDAGSVDTTSNPTLNLYKLQEFYETHQLYEKFFYPHPRRGNQIVRFRQPLIIPGTLLGKSGLVDNFEIVLTQQP